MVMGLGMRWLGCFLTNLASITRFLSEVWRRRMFVWNVPNIRNEEYGRFETMAVESGKGL